ncbi:hypothetical protein [Chitinophaga sp. sic0106]|uniref:hypothetical protein n=1 Tax=Chitinophaga sp. sic0106 TaxID=2854785 RepID=UPI001C448F49|nr:hypothetical protein [Chitinophaga sp. sic0106]MBV7530638.1 hypothetical protein [Chitinophaga sp. sic0106]
MVVNVNRYIYNVGFSVDDIEFGSEPPALFNQLFLGQGEFYDALLKLLPADKNSASKSPLAKLKDAMEIYKTSYDKLMDNYVMAYSSCGTLACCDELKNTGKQSFSTLSNQLSAVRNSYNDGYAGISSEINKAQLNLNNFNLNLDGCRKTITTKNALSEELKKLKEKPKENAAKIIETQKKIDALPTCDTLEIKEEINTAELAVKEYTLTKETLERLWTAFEKPAEDQLLKLVLFNNNMSREHLYYTAPPIYPQGHQLQFGLRISPRDTGSLVTKWNIMPLRNDSTGFDVTVVNKWYVSFSSGVFGSFGKRFKDETYEWQAQPNAGGVITDSAQYKLTGTGNGSSPIGFAALANLGVKLTKGFGVGLGVGAGLSIEDQPKPVYLAGLSLMFGTKQQFNITIGGVAAQVKKLRSELYPNMGQVVYDTKPTGISYKKSLEAGGFIAITYTIFTPGSKRSVISGH